MSRSLFDEALAAEAGVTDSLAAVARSIYQQESGGGRNTKTSNRGAVGGMQVMPGTFREVADKDWDINDPVHNIRAGLRYLKKLDLKAQGDPALLAAGYYGGPGGLEKARRGVAVSDPMNPQAPNTLQYGQQVVARMGAGGQDLTPGQVAVARPQAAPPVAAAPAIPVADPTLGKSGLPLPPELVQYLASRSRVPAVPAAQNAWLSFLDGMRGSSAAQISHDRANPEPVVPQVQDIDWAGAFRQAPVAPAGRVDFSPFSTLVKRV